MPLITGGRFGAKTEIEKAGSEVAACPSRAVMTMFWKLPGLGGVPLIRPFPLLNVAQPGRPVTVKVSGSPFGSLAVGVKL